MANLKQFRDPQLSLWQSAMDEVLATQSTGGAAGLDSAAAPERPDAGDAIMAEVLEYCSAVENGQLPASGTPVEHVAAAGLLDRARYCSGLALKLAKGVVRALVLNDKEGVERFRDQFEFGSCDPRYAEAVLRYAEYMARGEQVPYRKYRKLTDYVIDGKLPEQARVAILGDWGTGRPEALQVLCKIKEKNPDTVIHLGDIYYSGTDFEVRNYFLEPWIRILDLNSRPIPTFTLSGNHDMYAGGRPYYDAIDKLGQPASYFCLRNAHWQFIGMDTGLHAIKPGGGMTYLEDSEVRWIAHKIRNAGGRKTVLLSHHQLFSANEEIGGQEFNTRLYRQLGDLLPSVEYWFWGHEHDLVVFGEHLGLKRGRCVGHGAFPVGVDEMPSQPANPAVPVNPAFRLGKGTDCYHHGYAVMELDGPSAKVSYYQDSETDELIGVE
ncbi:MAG: metallophosphoesterase [Bryobacterales bacterium]|nr:metallophosphoesterase [Bryobacterales bacterium]